MLLLLVVHPVCAVVVGMHHLPLLEEFHDIAFQLLARLAFCCGHGEQRYVTVRVEYALEGRERNVDPLRLFHRRGLEREHPDDAEVDAFDLHILANRVDALIEDHRGGLLADDAYLAPLLVIQVIDRTAVNDLLRDFDTEIFGVRTEDREGRCAFLVPDVELALELILRGHQVDARHVFPNALDVFLDERVLPASGHALVSHRCAGRDDPDAVDGIEQHALLHAILQALAGAKQQYQHEDAPEHTKRRGKCPDLVGLDRLQYLLPLIKAEHGRGPRYRRRSCRHVCR